MSEWIIIEKATKAKVKEWWDKLPPNSNFFGKVDGKSFSQFWDVFKDAVLIMEFPFGVARAHLNSEQSAMMVHIVFWSREVVRSCSILREALVEAARIVGVTKVYATIPITMISFARLVERVGFQWSGTIKRFYYTDEGCYDALLYTMIIEGGTSWVGSTKI